MVAYCDISLQGMSAVVRKAVECQADAFQWALQPFSEYYASLVTTDFWLDRPGAPPSASGGDGEEEEEDSDNEDESNTGLCVDFVLNAFGFLTAVLSHGPYFDLGEPIAAYTASFWTPDLLRAMFAAVVTHGIIISDAELEEWKDDAESYEVNQVGCACAGVCGKGWSM